MADCDCAPASPPGSSGISIPDLLITVAYFSIPLQLVVAICRYPHLGRKAASFPVVILVVLFALFIFLCGAGHLLRCLNYDPTSTLFQVLNILTAAISLVTAVYLVPFAPLLLASVDRIMQSRAQSKAIVEDLYPEPNMRRRILASMSMSASNRVLGAFDAPASNNNANSRPPSVGPSVRSAGASDRCFDDEESGIIAINDAGTDSSTKNNNSSGGSRPSKRRSSGRMSITLSQLEVIDDDEDSSSSSKNNHNNEEDTSTIGCGNESKRTRGSNPENNNRNSNLRAIQNFFFPEGGMG
eukprot:CAMPEP_0181043436 /NCGR_PEP_ID=MMETSP1070-20121207/12708_1 /TAXON_ID=265543 /ORGANISM="Minutocellus polymorphus, Strain NH13" /LENGTH=297 /DNA_ID=CAMNT_0023121767 /DNA_START=127 /DNA_END=1016 /DNA_ORIENTATION=+